MKTQENKWDKFFWGLTVAALVIGLIGLLDRFTSGHTHANYGSYVPWGLWVAGYIYLMGLSAGVFLMSSLVFVFRIKVFEKIGKLALLTALATLVGGLLAIWLDLGHVGRVWRLVVNTNFTSVMGWMAWLYGAYTVLLIIELWYATRSDLSETAKENTLRVLGIIGIPLAITFSGAVGAIFGAVGARPYWNSGLTPIIFLVGALTSGAALLGFVTAVWGPNRGSEEHRNLVTLLGRIVLGLLGTFILLEWAEISIGLWSAVPSESASIKLVLFGNYWWVFWFIHLGLGVVIPGLFLLLQPRSVTAVGLAGVLIAITFLTVRLNIVIPALAVPELEGLKTAFTGPGLTFEYFPSTMEWLLFVFTVSMAALVFMAGKQILPILDSGTNKSSAARNDLDANLKEA